MLAFLRAFNTLQTCARFPVRFETTSADVLPAATHALKRPLIRVQPFVKPQMNELRERRRAHPALERPVAAVEPQVCLQVRCGTEALVADAALMGALPCVHEVMFLQMRQLGEAFSAFGTDVRFLSGMGA